VGFGETTRFIRTLQANGTSAPGRVDTRGGAYSLGMKFVKTMVGFGAAAVIAFGCIVLFGTAMEDAAASAAACMESANNLRECSRIDGAEFWERVVCLAVLGFFVGGMCFIYGQSYRAKP
jgi:hypothetical protein